MTDIITRQQADIAALKTRAGTKDAKLLALIDEIYHAAQDQLSVLMMRHSLSIRSDRGQWIATDDQGAMSIGSTPIEAARMAIGQRQTRQEKDG